MKNGQSEKWKIHCKMFTEIKFAGFHKKPSGKFLKTSDTTSSPAKISIRSNFVGLAEVSYKTPNIPHYREWS